MKNISSEEHTQAFDDPRRPRRFRTNLALSEKKYQPRQALRGKIFSLSKTGAFIETVPEREGRIIDLEFAFPNQKETFLITGRIMWVRTALEADPEHGKPMGIGVRFNHFTRGSAEELQKLLEKREKMEATENGSSAHEVHLSCRATPTPETNLPWVETLPAVPLPHDLPEKEIDQAFEFLLQPFDL